MHLICNIIEICITTLLNDLIFIRQQGTLKGHTCVTSFFRHNPVGFVFSNKSSWMSRLDISKGIRRFVSLHRSLIRSNSRVLTDIVSVFFLCFFPAVLLSWEATERSLISQQIASMQQHRHSGSWKGELSGPQRTRWCKEASILGGY